MGVTTAARAAGAALLLLLAAAPAATQTAAGGDSIADSRGRALRLFSEGNFTEAEPLLADLLERSPTDFPVLKALGIIYVERGRDREGLPLLARAAEIRPGDLDVSAYIGVARYHLAEYDAAIERLEGVLRVDPAHATALTYLSLARGNRDRRIAGSRIEAAEAAAGRGDLEEAIRLLEEALAIDSGNVRAAARLGSMRARRAHERLESLWRSLGASFDPAAAEAFVESGLAALAEGAEPALAARTAEVAGRLAEADLSGGGAEVAAARLERLAPILPMLGAADRARLAALRGRALDAAGRLDEALAAYDEALRLDAASPVRWARRWAWLRRHWALAAGLLLLAAGAAEAARRRLPAWTEAARRRYREAAAARAEASGDAPAAVEHLGALAAARPADAAIAARLAEALRRAGRRAAAVDAYRRAIELDPKRPALRRALAETLESLERRAEALEAWEGLLAGPVPAAEEAAAARAAAALALALDRPDRVVVHLERALRAGAPRDLETLRTMARALAATGRADEANAALHEILRRSPEAVGDLLKEYRQIFRTAPGDGEVHLILARHFLSTGDAARAAAAFESAAAARPALYREAIEAHRIAGDLERAVGAARRWTEAEPAARAPRHALVASLLRLAETPGGAERLAEAADAALAAVRAEKDDLEAFRLAQEAARALRRAGRDAEARRLLESILGVTSFDETEARFLLGEILAAAGDADGAIETVQRIEKGGAAIETRVKTLVASCWVAKGLPAVGRKVLETLDLDRPGVTIEMRKEAHYWRGRAAEAEGDAAEAVRAYDAILQIDIRFRDAYRRREDLIRALADAGGRTAAAPCPRCGAGAPAGARFCPACGAPLA